MAIPDQPRDADSPVGFTPAPDFPFAPNGPEVGSGPDPFDLSRLRLQPDDDAALGVRELVVNVPFRNPSREWFFRVHHGAEYRCTAGLLILKDTEQDTYWIDPALWSHLTEIPSFETRMVVTAVNRMGTVFLWALRFPPAEGRVPDWTAIPLEAARSAEKSWTKLYWDPSQRRHRIKVATGIADEPVWPEQSFAALLRLAFKDRVVTTLDHPILLQQRGEK